MTADGWRGLVGVGWWACPRGVHARLWARAWVELAVTVARHLPIYCRAAGAGPAGAGAGPFEEGAAAVCRGGGATAAPAQQPRH